MTFEQLGLAAPLLKALEAEGYHRPSPIQEQAIPILLSGKDLLGCAQTGTGKTAAFALPILHHLLKGNGSTQGPKAIRALVVCPTRELALQIEERFNAYARFTQLKALAIFGGVKQGPQVATLRKGIDVLIATPGRLLDLMEQRIVSLNEVRFSVLDEADHMFDLGFVRDIRKIIKTLPSQRQSLFFSATMPLEIEQLAHDMLGDPMRIAISPEVKTAERVDQSVYFVAKDQKIDLLLELLKDNSFRSYLVFSRTKHGADKIVRKIKAAGLNAEAIHGDKSQGKRQQVLREFRTGKLPILIATDIAARGIDIDELGLVINFDLPNVPETYVHRIGRTGRASASGKAISLCTFEDRSLLRDIQKLLGREVPVAEHPVYSIAAPEPPAIIPPAMRRKTRPHRIAKPARRR
jgi:ATP-dependent RNA helicase RhlE